MIVPDTMQQRKLNGKFFMTIMEKIVKSTAKIPQIRLYRLWDIEWFATLREVASGAWLGK